MNISGLDKAAVLAALYNASKPQGMGFLHYKPGPMTVEEAAKCLSESAPQFYFDYLSGRVMKISLASDEMRTDLYDRDNGEGVAEAVIGILRATGDTAHPDIIAIHKGGKAASIKAIERSMETPPTVGVSKVGGRDIPTAHDVKDQLKPYVDKAKEE